MYSIPPGLECTPFPLTTPSLSLAPAVVTAKPKCHLLQKLLLKQPWLNMACPPASPQRPALLLLPNGWSGSICRQLVPLGNDWGGAMALIQQPMHNRKWPGILSFIQQMFIVPGTLEGTGKGAGNRRTKQIWALMGLHI